MCASYALFVEVQYHSKIFVKLPGQANFSDGDTSNFSLPVC